MRETRSSGSVEGVVSNHDPYSDYRMASHLRVLGNANQGRFQTVNATASDCLNFIYQFPVFD
jgi:hypothetical protein